MNYDLDHDHIRDAAIWAAHRLADVGVARVRLAPGDMTEYRIDIAAPGAIWAYGEERADRDYGVTLCANFGCGYPWAGREVHPDYATEKWTNPSSSKGTRAHTGRVMAAFLSALATAIGEAYAHGRISDDSVVEGVSVGSAGCGGHPAANPGPVA